ncbi:MAG: LCP family protein [Acidimicrobiales bacterium]
MWFRIDRSDASLAGSAEGSGTTYLLIGSDRRGDVPTVDRKRFGTTREVPGERADVVIAVRVAPNGTVRSLAIPRDLVLFRTNRGPERVASMLEAGPGAVADALCHSLGIGIDHLAVVHFAGLTALVDQVGGVKITATTALLDRNSGLLLKAGTHRVDGRTALAYVRARHIESWDGTSWEADPIASDDRTGRASAVLSQLGSRLNLDWTSPLATHRLLWTATGAVTVDGDAGVGDLLSLGDALRGLGSTYTASLPALTRGGAVPMASLTPDSAPAVKRFLGRGRPAKACATPALLTAPA